MTGHVEFRNGMFLRRFLKEDVDAWVKPPVSVQAGTQADAVSHSGLNFKYSCHMLEKVVKIAPGIIVTLLFFNRTDAR